MIILITLIPPPGSLRRPRRSSKHSWKPLGADERDVWQRADSSRQGLNGHRQVYSHLCLFPHKGRDVPFESQPVRMVHA